MRTRTKVIAAVAAVAAVAVVGAVAAGPSLAQRAYGGMGMMGMGMMGGEQLMREVDTDRDGKLTQAEIDAAVNARFARFDADQNGRLSMDEFMGLWADLTRPMAVRAFQFMDPNGDGAVAKTEVDERFGRVVQRFDRNGDSALSMEDRGGRGRGGGHGGGRDAPR